MVNTPIVRFRRVRRDEKRLKIPMRRRGKERNITRQQNSDNNEINFYSLKNQSPKY
jgi:hypothetical protein